MRPMSRRGALVVGSILGAVACHDATKPAVPIVDQRFSVGIGTRVVSTGAVFFMATLDSTQNGFQLVIDTFPITSPGTHALGKGDPTFAQATARLTDGHLDIVEYGLRFVPNGGGLTSLDQDWHALGRSATDGDLAAYTLTSVQLVLDTVTFASPGSNPNGDGIWSEADIIGHLVIYGDSL